MQAVCCDAHHQHRRKSSKCCKPSSDVKNTVGDLASQALRLGNDPLQHGMSMETRTVLIMWGCKLQPCRWQGLPKCMQMQDHLSAGAIKGNMCACASLKRMQRCVRSQAVVLAKPQCPIRVYKRQSSSPLLASPRVQPLCHSRFLRMQSALEKVKERMGAKHTPEAGLSVSQSGRALRHLHGAVDQMAMV